MEWKYLLSTKRQKELFKGGKSKNSEERPEFQRDYDRCLFSTPVRRLQDKAQVFPLEPNDSVRTRLTHSLEVSNIAKSIADNLFIRKNPCNIKKDEHKQQIPVIAMTCGLIHDLGNPPFGHAGEYAMREWFSGLLKNDEVDLKEIHKNDLLNFEGNAQSLRLISKLQMLGDLSGLNLTAGTLSASRKYIANASSIDTSIPSHKKLGFFDSESELVHKIEKETGTQGARNPITYLVEAADDIVYSVVDLEDGIKKGALTWELISSELEQTKANHLIKEVEDNINKRAKDEDFAPLEKHGFKELHGKALDEARMVLLRTFLIRDFISEVVKVFAKYYKDIMNGEYNGELLKDSEWGEVCKKCKDISHEHVINSEPILRLEVLGREVLKDLMDHFWEGIREAPYDNKNTKGNFHWKIYSLMSVNYRTVLERNLKDTEDEKEQNYYKLQLLADYICGMTDNYACQLHKEINNG